jgi:hypothetical protein
MISPSRNLLPAAMTDFIFLSGCELADAIEVAVSGPRCGRFGIPPELEGKELHVLDHRFDWDRLDEMLAVLEPYEDSHGPDILWALGVLYIRKAVALSDDPAYFRRGVRLNRWAALCGSGVAVEMLSGVYSEGFPGVEKDTKLAACLDRAYDPALYERALIPGRVWGCGLRMEDVPE